jgi:hypothetical protein
MNSLWMFSPSRIPRLLCFVIAAIGISACAAGPNALRTDFSSRHKSLELWLNRALIPYLIEQFDQHPRFRGQPVMLVRMQDQNVSTHIDELTAYIRQKIADAILKQPGIMLAWRPSVQHWQHHQSLEDISCGEHNNVHYYVGIDAGLNRTGRQLYVKVRALNLAENKWVSGFGKSWQGVPNEEQKKALQKEHADEYLRGLRPLPFSHQQPDMLAAYLARNLSCLLQQGEADSLVVYVAKPELNDPRTYKTALELVGRYLARFREVEVTDDPTEANVTIVSAMHSIDGNLHQVWISARQRKGDKYLPGAGTEAYVSFETSDENPLDTAGVGLNAVSSAPLTPFQNNSGPNPFISSFELLTPRDHRYCVNGTTWRSGLNRVDFREALSTGSCLTIEVEISAPAYIFLIGQDAAGELSQIYPTDCHSPGRQFAQYHPEGLFRFPAESDPRSGVLQIAGAPGIESIYAIVITRSGLAGMFDERIKHVQGLCRPGTSYPDFLQSGGLRWPHERIQRWQNYLTWLSSNHPEIIDWREIRFRHAEM